jgi:hypothetical protein
MYLGRRGPICVFMRHRSIVLRQAGAGRRPIRSPALGKIAEHFLPTPPRSVAVACQQCSGMLPGIQTSGGTDIAMRAADDVKVMLALQNKNEVLRVHKGLIIWMREDNVDRGLCFLLFVSIVIVIKVRDTFMVDG